MRAIVVAALLLAGCASAHEPGWSGSRAQPFDSAKAACEIETQTVEGAAFEACMASKGWIRSR
jgi:outer membrane murein-binding lipoprotein Lpp